MKSFTIVALLIFSSFLCTTSIANDVSKQSAEPAGKIEVITVTPNYVRLDAMLAVSEVRAEVASKDYWKNEFLEAVKLLVEDQEAGRLIEANTIIGVGAIDPSSTINRKQQPASFQGPTAEAGAI